MKIHNKMKKCKSTIKTILISTLNFMLMASLMMPEGVGAIEPSGSQYQAVDRTEYQPPPYQFKVQSPQGEGDLTTWTRVEIVDGPVANDLRGLPQKLGVAPKDIRVTFIVPSGDEATTASGHAHVVGLGSDQQQALLHSLRNTGDGLPSPNPTEERADVSPVGDGQNPRPSWFRIATVFKFVEGHAGDVATAVAASTVMGATVFYVSGHFDAAVRVGLGALLINGSQLMHAFHELLERGFFRTSYDLTGKPILTFFKKLVFASAEVLTADIQNLPKGIASSRGAFLKRLDRLLAAYGFSLLATWFLTKLEGVHYTAAYLSYLAGYATWDLSMELALTALMRNGALSQSVLTWWTRARLCVGPIVEGLFIARTDPYAQATMLFFLTTGVLVMFNPDLAVRAIEVMKSWWKKQKERKVAQWKKLTEPLTNAARAVQREAVAMRREMASFFRSPTPEEEAWRRQMALNHGQGPKQNNNGIPCSLILVPSGLGL